MDDDRREVLVVDIGHRTDVETLPFTTGVTFWAILGVSVAIMRIQSRKHEE